ncbi:prolamin-like domain-containing protein [Artemisia annua]|uniref:Prolamin-like domain-containing protein n=1 Tax=Artemisia annua TaxID=35608 RepID=A0A2U1QIL8_ARTAN|nr:prolamin-like domain-containing protein [Artemisia annua]
MANVSLITVLILVATMSLLVNTRPLTNTTTYDASTLAARLKLDYYEEGGSPGCWETLFELQSCTGEILLFFLNGETYLGPACCMAIVKIEKQCWPNLLGSLGFNSQEGDILRGYCDASEDNRDGPMATPPPKLANITGRLPRPANTTPPPPKPANTTGHLPRSANTTPPPPKPVNITTSD